MKFDSWLIDYCSYSHKKIDTNKFIFCRGIINHKSFIWKERILTSKSTKYNFIGVGWSGVGVGERKMKKKKNKGFNSKQTKLIFFVNASFIFVPTQELIKKSNVKQRKYSIIWNRW